MIEEMDFEEALELLDEEGAKHINIDVWEALENGVQLFMTDEPDEDYQKGYRDALCVLHRLFQVSFQEAVESFGLNCGG